MKVRNQARLDQWFAMAEKWPPLQELLFLADDWAYVNERLFDNRQKKIEKDHLRAEQVPQPTLSWDELDYYDKNGTAKRFLIEVWEHGDELARQIQSAKDAELELRNRRRNTT